MGQMEVQSSQGLVLDLSGKSRTTLYGNPKIDLRTFHEQASLFKKEINW